MVENKALVEQKSPTMPEFLVCDPGSLLSNKTVGCIDMDMVTQLIHCRHQSEIMN